MRKLVLMALLLWPAPAFATQVQEVVSAKGVKAWLVEDHALPLIAVKFTFLDSGIAYDPKGKGGRASMAASMLMEGAGQLDATAFSKALEDHAIELGFGADEDGFSGSMSSISEYTPQAFSYLGMALNAPRFDAVAMERVRQQMLSAQTQQQKDPEYLLQRRWAAQIYGDHPYANAALGTDASVKALSDADLKGYMQAYLARDRLVVSVVGDITPEALKPLLDEEFGNLPATAKPDVVVSDVKLPLAAKQDVVDSDIPQTVAVFGTQGIMRDDKAFYDAYVMNYLLGGSSLSSKLFSEVREKRGLTYSISSNLMPMRHAAVWGGGFATRNEKVGEAVAALRDVLGRFAKEGPTDKELKQAKQYLTGSFVLGLDSNHEIASYLITMQVNHLGIDYLDRRNALMEGVTKEGVKAIAAKLVDPKGLQVVMVGKPVLEKAKP